MASQINASNSGFGGIVSTGDSSGQLQLQTVGTTAVTIDTSQNVGIGTASPASPLDISGNTSGSVIQNIRNLNTTLNSASTLIVRSNNNTEYIQLVSFAQAAGYLTFSNASGGVIGTNNAQPLYFNTNSAERMRIDSSGGVSIGSTATYLGTEKFSISATAAGWPMSLYASGSAANGMYIKYSTTPNSAGAEFFYYTDATAVRAYMRSNGGLSNYSANNTTLSDQREKTNIELAGSYLDKICAIPVKTFNYIDQNMEEDGGLTLGVIAQDVQTVAPELVTESNWGTEEEPKQRLSIYQTDLQYALMKCIQEQQTIINDLKARIETLEAK